MPRFEHDGISHYYTTAGIGYPIIFIHGMGLSHQMWIGPAPIFARHYTVISYDLRGHGGTGTSSGPIEIRDLSDDLLALYETLGIEKAVLVSYSSGTLICENFALEHPERVAGMCLIGSFTTASNNIYMALKSQVGKLMLQTKKLQKMNAYSVATNNAENLVQRGFFYRIAKRVSPEESMRMIDACERFILTKQLKDIKCPVLIVHGSRDRATQAYAKQMATVIPNIEISVVEGCNHAVATRAMGAFNVVLEEWLNKLELPSDQKTEQKTDVRQPELQPTK